MVCSSERSSSQKASCSMAGLAPSLVVVLVVGIIVPENPRQRKDFFILPGFLFRSLQVFGVGSSDSDQTSDSDATKVQKTQKKAPKLLRLSAKNCRGLKEKMLWES